jgi:hypothetical protein
MLQKITGNWTLSPLLRITSGFPITPLSGKDNALDGVVTNTGGGVVQRPNYTCDPTTGFTQSANMWFNTSCTAANGAGQLGNAGRNSLRGPREIDVNVSLSRNFSITERQHIEVRAEAFNLPNIVNYMNINAQPNATLTSSLYGKLTAAQDPRILQFAMKYVF